MASTTIKKNTQGYGYRYADIAEIHEYLESQKMRYYQYIETSEDGSDYIMTVPIIDGKEQTPRRGCKVVMATLTGRTNPAQEQGSALTYARRYSLLMAFGLATDDDDANCMTQPKAPTEPLNPKKAEQQKVEKQLINETKVKALMAQCEKDGIEPSVVCDKCHVKGFSELTEKQFYWLQKNWSAEIVNGEQSKN